MCAEKSPAHIPQVKIVNGEIVLDKSTLYSNVDEEQEEPNVVDEGAFVRMKRGPKRTPQRWTEQETDLFLEV
ncbi:hypothetical protein BDA99DRAFT_520301 [Phascolomyces articulosus]|uniref:Uncharacterized protein n=1 Tax=Phascolomyces articulosus TaxID=60185 RepID=A0AAD5JSU9_9FUNG|nr:hypothetical protein BDA99DRAFT_520301 [Phascolomyces articulosus]